MIEVMVFPSLDLVLQPPTPEWGLILTEGRQYLQTSLGSWHSWYVHPYRSCFIFNLWSDSLQDRWILRTKVSYVLDAYL